MAGENDGATPAGVPDLNDPNTHLSRTDALKAMIDRRRETVLTEMTPEDGAALVAARLPVAPATLDNDEDTDVADAVAAAERARLEATAAAAAPSHAAPTQLERQTDATPTDTTIDDADLARYRVRTKVNGVETIVPLNELRAGYQKVAAGDSYLETAKQTLAEVNQLARQLREGAQASPSTATASGAADSGTTSTDPDAIDVFVDSLFQGDEAKAKQALRKKLAAPPAAQMNPGQLASEVERNMVIRSAVRQFAKDYKGIYDAPGLRAQAEQFIGAELATRGLQRLEDADPDEIPRIVSAAGERTKQEMAKAIGVPLTPANAPRPTVDRQAAKQKIDEPQAANTRAASSVPPPKTTTDTIAAMQRARQPWLYGGPQ